MLASIKNIFAIPDLRGRVLFTLFLLAVYRLGAQIPTPGVNGQALSALFRAEGGIFGFLDMFTGRALSNFTIFALGIMPYISASIILQLLTVVVPYLEKLSKEGEVGRRKITQYTRYLTIVLSVVQALGIAIALERQQGPSGFGDIVPHPGWAFRFIAVLTLTTGTAFIMWLGEQITERGIGNGMSLLIFASIVVGLMPAIVGTVRGVVAGDMNPFKFLLLVVFMVVVCALIVFVERGQRRFPVQYARRVVGRKVYGGQSTHLPIRVNTGGVIPVIFASSLILLPQTVFNILKARPGAIGSWADAMYQQLSWGYPLYNLVYIVGIIFFCYFYTSIIFNPGDVADNMRKYGGFIPGIRPGNKTRDYIYRVLNRITFGGALYLAMVAVIPEFLISGFKLGAVPGIGPPLESFLTRFNLDWIVNGLGVQFYFGGTSLLIVIGVAMDTVQQVESQLIMRHYDGFVRKTRIRGRRA
jgi:preprotein translocase subunit SecY